MKKKSLALALAFVAALSLWLLSGQFGGETSDSDAGPAAQTSAVPELTKVRVRALEASERPGLVIVQGRTQAARSVDLRAETAGKVIEVGATEGAMVKKGDLIARLATDDRQAKLAEAQALLSQREIENAASERLASQSFTTRTKLAETRARLDEAKARLAAIRQDIAQTRITAPFDGILNERMVEIGDYLAIGGPVASVIDLSPIVVIGEVPEIALAGLSVGTPGEARLSTGQVIQGEVAYISASAKAETRTFTIKLEAPNPDSRIAEGLTAELRLALPARPAHHVSPAVLTLDDEGRIGVKIVDDTGIVVFRPVQVISEDAKGMWLGGLPAKITIITVGHEYVGAGQKVTAVPESDISQGQGPTT